MLRCCIEQMDNLGRMLCHSFPTGIRCQDIRDMASVNHWMDISVRHLRILFSFYGLYLEEKVLEEIAIAYGVLSSGTISIRLMHESRAREVDFSTGRIRMFLTWNKSVESRVWVLVGYPSSVYSILDFTFLWTQRKLLFLWKFMRRTWFVYVLPISFR